MITDDDLVTSTTYVNAYLEITSTQEGIGDPVTENTFSYYLGGKLVAVNNSDGLSYVLQDRLSSVMVPKFWG